MAEGKSAEADAFQAKIVEFISRDPKGVSDAVLKDLMIPHMSVAEYVAILNKLIAEHKVQVLQKGKQLVYKLKDSSSLKKYQDIDVEGQVVYQAVEKAGNNGVTSKDLKFQCKLSLPQINKILKTLEIKKLIKKVESTSKRKLFMLYDLEPNQTISGGIFYDGQTFDSVFAYTLGDQCYKYLVQAKAVADKHSDPISQKNASYKSSKDVCAYINSLKISKDILKLENIESILNALVYDEKVEKCVSVSNTHSLKDSGTENLYRVTKPLIKHGGLMMVPCGVCSVYQDCCVGGTISPATCEYMQQWLDF